MVWLKTTVTFYFSSLLIAPDKKIKNPFYFVLRGVQKIRYGVTFVNGNSSRMGNVLSNDSVWCDVDLIKIQLQFTNEQKPLGGFVPFFFLTKSVSGFCGLLKS